MHCSRDEHVFLYSMPVEAPKTPPRSASLTVLSDVLLGRAGRVAVIKGGGSGGLLSSGFGAGRFASRTAARHVVHVHGV